MQPNLNVAQQLREATQAAANRPLNAIPPSRPGAALDKTLGARDSLTVDQIDQWLREFAVRRLDQPHSRQGLRVAEPRYKLEKIDPKHRFGNYLYHFLDYYKTMRPRPPQAFFPWLDGLTRQDVTTILSKYDCADEQSVTRFMNGVTYLSEQQRKEYQVVFSDGKLKWMNQLLDTNTGSRSRFIWVLGSDNVFYTNASTVATFHHSSFFSGQGVKAAGEWIVDQGMLEGLTGQTGHYQSTRAEMLDALRALRGNVDLASVELAVYKADMKEAWVKALQFLEDPSLQKQLTFDPNGGGIPFCDYRQ